MQLTEQEQIDVPDLESHDLETTILETGEPQDAPEAFVPDTAKKADWVLGRIADRRARAARIRENAEIMARQEEAEAEALEWRFGPALQDFTRRETQGGRRKSVRLYNGVLGFRTKPAQARVDNDAKALAWAKDNLPAAVVERLDKAALGKALLETGEVADGVTLVPAEEVFYIK